MGGAIAATMLLVSLAVNGAGVGSAQAGEPDGFRLVVNPESPATQVDRAFVADAFLKKVTRWPDGEAIRAVDQRFEAPARHSFCRDVLRRSLAAIRHYWQQRIFTGRGVPPPELASDEAVLDYVRQHRGAVGYVSASAETRSVKVIELR
jgi:ABC-type phosphate transport system substrate-binding protein